MTVHTIYTPRDDMERSLCRELIAANLKTWPVEATLRDEIEPGVWQFQAYLPQSTGPVNLRDIDSLTPASATGTVYVTDNQARAQTHAIVYWELPAQPHAFAQSNSGEWPPVLR